MKKLPTLLIALAAALCCSFAQAENPYAAYYKNLPIALTEVVAPVIPDYTINLRDFGGVADGVTKNTEAFAKAMKHLTDKGGGHLVVPAGIWFTGPISIVDNVDLHLDNGAFVLFSEDYNDYPTVTTSYEGLNANRCTSPINAVGRTNISITGQGTFNGSGNNWRPVKRSKLTADQWKELKRKGVTNAKDNVWYPTENIMIANEKGQALAKLESTDKARYEAAVHDGARPVMVSLVKCNNVLLQGVTFENSPAWNLHPLMCTNIIIDNVNVRNPWYAQNGDGIDLESCTRALIVNSTFDVGDDAICIKSGKDKDGRDRGVPCSDVLVTDCTVYHGHGGFVIGSEMSGGCNDIVVRNCVFDGTDVGLRFKSTRGRGGVVENIYIDGIRMYNIAGNALIFNLYYGGTDDRNTKLDAKGQPIIPPVTEETPAFRNIYMNDVVCQSAERAALFNGLPEMPIKNIVISNSTFKADLGVALNYVDGLTIDNVTLNIANEQPITKQNDVTNVMIR